MHCQATTLGKLLTPMCLCHQAVQFGTSQRAVMLCDREGNRRSGVALVLHHRLLWFIHLRAHGHREGDEHPILCSNIEIWYSVLYLMKVKVHRNEGLKCLTPVYYRIWFKIVLLLCTLHLLASVQSTSDTLCTH